MEQGAKSMEAMVADACAAYGVKEKDLLGRRVDEQTGTVILLTRGGKRVDWRPGKEVQKLTRVEATGEPEQKSKKKSEREP
jgi:hypothetical protein